MTLWLIHAQSPVPPACIHRLSEQNCESALAVIKNRQRQIFSRLQVLAIAPPGQLTELAELAEPGRVYSWQSSDVRQVAAMIEAVGHFVCADSGVMHLAASTRAKVVGLFCHTDPLTYSPLSATGWAINPALGQRQVARALLSELTS
jgi:ADP-heptose:LPS heptosyltransferase